MWHFIRLFMGLKTPLLKSNIWLSIPVKISCKYELRFKDTDEISFLVQQKCDEALVVRIKNLSKT